VFKPQTGLPKPNNKPAAWKMMQTNKPAAWKMVQTNKPAAWRILQTDFSSYVLVQATRI
jgi:hypothetical protein